MKISICNEHFYQHWFLFTEGKEMKRLIELMDTIHCIYPHEQNGEIFPAVEEKEVESVCDLYSWCEKPRIRFSTRGIDLGRGEIRSGNSYYNGEYPLESFFNAEIYLPELDEMIIRWFSCNVSDLLIYAKYMWCNDMGLNYIHSEEAKEIKLKFENAKKDIKELNFSNWDNEKDEYNQVLYKLRTMPYKQYLKTEHWRHFRQESIKFYQKKCQLCSNAEENNHNLHLHHNNYDNRGRETFNDVILLCSKCHREYHNK